MHRRIEIFLQQNYPAQSFFSVVQVFMEKRRNKDASEASNFHLWRSLIDLGEELNNPPLNTITYRDLKDYVRKLWLRYKRGTIIPMVGDVKQFFKWCKKENFHQKNIAKNLRKPRRKATEIKCAAEEDVFTVMTYLTSLLTEKKLVYRDKGDVLRVASMNKWSYTDTYIIRDLFIIVFLYETGARAQELANLGTVVMDRACAQTQPAYTITSVGKEDDRDYHFTNATAEIWHIWRTLKPDALQEYAIVGWRKGESPKPLKTNGISQMLKRQCEKSGAKVFRAHALRHAKVKRSRKLVGIEVASRLVDHSSLETTRYYSNIDADEVARATLLTGLQKNIWGGEFCNS